jgi:Fe-S cluster assembly iron-binding protein IscA
MPLSVTITDSAREKLEGVMKDSEYEKPALRIIFSGFG